MTAPDYGVDAPVVVRKVFWRGGTLTVIAVLLWFMNGAMANAIASVLLSIGIVLLLTGAIMIWSSRVAKLRLRDRILDAIPWRGDEKVLDVGCGRGLMLIGAAKRLKSGKALGVDIWRAQDLSGNDPQATMANAKAEAVAERIKLENADARQLPFADASMDVVVSSLALHNIDGEDERTRALGEIARVLKPGGHVAVLDIFHTPDYAKELERLGLSEVKLSGLSLLWCLPTRWLVARK